MRNVDGRIPATKESSSRNIVGASNVLAAAGVIPYGNGLWQDLTTMASGPGLINAEKPTVGRLIGIMEFNQGWQTGHPVQNWGIPTFGRADIIRSGYVGYKVSMTAVGQEANYLAYLQGDRAMDVVGVRQTYTEWLAAYSAAGDGAKLGLFFGNASGFPIMAVVPFANIANPTLAGATFAGFVMTFENENEAVFVEFQS
jgi:hypothetical protein